MGTWTQGQPPHEGEIILQLQGIANNDQDFILRLKDHLLACQNNTLYNGNEHAFSNEEQDSITFVSNCVYKHDIIHINYTTYDLRHAQDSINMQTNPYLITLGHEDEEEGMKWHPY